MILSFCGYLGVLLCFLPEGITLKIGGTIECLPTTVQLYVNRTLYPSECTGGTTGQVLFTSSSDGGSTTKPRCTVPDITVCSFTPGTQGCGCTSSNASLYSLEYNFDAQQIMDTWWTASVGCADNNLAPALDFLNCTFVPPTTPPPTTGPTTTDNCTLCDCNKDECTLCCFLCIFVIILCVIVGGFITAVISLYCCCPKVVKTCAEEPGCRHCFCGPLVALFVCMDKCSCNKGSTSSPEARNAGNNDKETNMPMTGDRKPDVDGKDEEDGAPSAGNRDNAVGSETRQKKKKKKNKQMEKQAADGDDMSPVAVSVTSSPEPTLVVQASSGRQLPQPHKAGTPETSTGREGAGKREETTLDQKPSHGKGSRSLPLPFEGQGNGTSTTTTTTTTSTSTTPRSLAPVRNPPPSSMPSVERNSFAERSGPSPSQE